MSQIDVLCLSATIWQQGLVLITAIGSETRAACSALAPKIFGHDDLWGLLSHQSYGCGSGKEQWELPSKQHKNRI